MFEEDKKFDIQNRLFYLLTIFIIGLLLYLFLSLILYFKRLDKRAEVREISFSAEEKVTQKPEFAIFHFAVITRGLKANETQRANDEKRDSIFSSLFLLNLPKEEIREIRYNIAMVSDTALGMRVQKFQITKEYEIKTKELEKIPEIIKRIGERGGILTSEVRLQPEDIEKLREEVRSLLISKVKTKALRQAKQLGITLGGVVGMKEDIIPKENGEEILKITLTYLIK